VESKEAGIKAMRDLRVGDEIRTKDGWTEVYGWLHHEPEAEALFRTLRVESGEELRVTPDHTIWINGTARPASRAEEGARVWAGGERRVASITESVRRGAFAPLTRSGTLLVDGVLVSCYVTGEIWRGDEIAHAAMAPLRWTTRVWALERHSTEKHWWVRLVNGVGDLFEE
jgi:hypothetical protein